jgi:ATP-dependent RNA helicase RhlE
MPDTVDAYTHRIGRTGRASKTGEAFTLVTPEDALMVRTIERMLGARPKSMKLEGFEYDTAAPKHTGDYEDRARSYTQRKARPVATASEWRDKKSAPNGGKRSNSETSKGGRSENGWNGKSATCRDGAKGRPKGPGRPSYAR